MKNLYLYLKFRYILRRNIKRAMREVFKDGAFPMSIHDLDGLGSLVDDGVNTSTYDLLTKTTYPEINKKVLDRLKP